MNTTGQVKADGTSAGKRIAIVLPDLGGGGAERVALTLINDFLGRGHEIDLVLVRAEGEFLPLVPSRVRIVDLGARRLIASLFPLVRYLRRRRPHGMQVSMWPLTVVAILACRLARVPTRIVTSDHTTLSEQYGHLPRTIRMLRATVRFFYPMADARVLVSAGAADDLARISGLPRGDFAVIHNPVPVEDEPAIDPGIDALWDGAKARVVTVGSLKEVKNQALLIQAFARLRSRREAKLMIVGDGPLRHHLQALATSEGVADDTMFTGFVLNPRDYIATAHLFVLSSDYEGFPLALVEAMSVGVDIVSTDCRSGPREILHGLGFGRLVPCSDVQALAEAMEMALDHPSDPEVLKARADALAGQGAIDRYAQLLVGPRAS